MSKSYKTTRWRHEGNPREARGCPDPAAAAQTAQNETYSTLSTPITECQAST